MSGGAVALSGADPTQAEEVEIEATEPGQIEFDYTRGVAVITNAFIVRFKDATLTAQRGSFNTNSGVLVLEGNVNLQRENQVWRGERLQYNLYSKEMATDSFRTGRSPLFAAGEGLSADITNHVYSATNAYVTLDDVSEPVIRVKAKKLKLVPGGYVAATHAFLYVGNLPVLYFPYYRQDIGKNASHISLTPGYRSEWGYFVRSAYEFHLNDKVSAALDLDYFTLRGLGLGGEVRADGGRWGSVKAKAFYIDDQDPNASLPSYVPPVDPYRNLVNVAYEVYPTTNLTGRVVFSEQSDPYVTHDFFESQFRSNPQPISFLELNQSWADLNLSFLAQPQVNSFFDTVERLPEVMLNAPRQQIGRLPFYYEGESSVGFLRRAYAEGSPFRDYDAVRADTFHQLQLPLKPVEWLDVTPRVGGRFTYYGATEADGREVLESRERWVFNTGVEVSWKASRLWRDATNGLFEVDGLRHIIQPSFNYAYVPQPNVVPLDLPQFDYQQPSLALLPIIFPDDNSIDSIDSRNVLRMGLRNKLQTRRGDKLDNLLNWDLVTDWRITQEDGQPRFSNVYSDIDLKPRSWLTLSAALRYDVQHNQFAAAYPSMTLEPNDRWSWGLGYSYVRQDLLLQPTGASLLNSIFYLRLNEDWGLRFNHQYNLEDNRLQEQTYSVYRDFRSVTVAVAFRVRQNLGESPDYGAAVTFSFKAFPRFKLGDDKSRHSLLLGG